MTGRPPCSVLGCERPIKTWKSGLCSAHLQRQNKGLPLDYRPIINRTYLPAETRFWLKVDKNGLIPAERPELGPCWTWTAQINNQGYAVLGVASRPAAAHRFAYQLLVGPIPEGLHLDHLCRNRGCVNPSHLEPVTCRENLLRGNTHAAMNVAKTHCPHGHEYTTENTGTYKGSRYCRTCGRLRARTRFGYQGNPRPEERTQCPRGHPYDEANTYVTRSGHRTCRTCHNERGREYKRLKRAAERVPTQAS